MNRITVLLLALASLAGCTDIGETAADAVGVSWTWQWELRVACPDGTREPLDAGEVCTSDVDAWKCRAFPEFCAAEPSWPISPDACGGDPAARVELVLDPEDLGAC